MAAVLLDASKPDGLEQLELVSVLQLTCQELDDGGGGGEARLPPPVCSRTIKSRLELWAGDAGACTHTCMLLWC